MQKELAIEGLLVSGIALVGLGTTTVQTNLVQGLILIGVGCMVIGYRAVLKKYFGE